LLLGANSFTDGIGGSGYNGAFLLQSMPGHGLS
jgi:hypothetical protein